MGDANPIRTLGDYSRPSHEGYRNTIELPEGNNVVPLRSDTIWLVQNGCSFHGLRFEDPNQHLKDFLKLVDSLDLDVANRERTRLRLFQFSLRDQASNWLKLLLERSISTWEDVTTPFLAQFFPPEGLQNSGNTESIRTIKLEEGSKNRQQLEPKDPAATKKTGPSGNDEEKEVECKEDTAYLRLDFTRNRICSRSNTAYPADYICRNCLTKSRRRITMAEPIPEDYISVTRKNFLSGDNEGRMIEKSFLEIQGTFLIKIRDNTFNGTIGENAVGHIENFLEVVGPLKIKGVSNLFEYETPLCKAFDEFNYLLKIDTDLLMGDQNWKKRKKDDYRLRFGEQENPNKSGKKSKNYRTNNAGNTQDNQGPREQHHTHDPSVCGVRRFEMIKYSFDADDEYVAVKEHEYFNHSRTNVDACQAYRELFRIMDKGWLVTKAKEE
ncbi:zinc finger, CCHC-type containing protein [Tanacetum coccineum]